MSFKSWSSAQKPVTADKAADKPKAAPAAAQASPQPFIGPVAPVAKPAGKA